jgi:hypothetical protein
MNRFNARVVMTVTAALLLCVSSAGAQVREIPGESGVMTATIEAIERSTRTVTLKGSDGIYETFQAPPEIRRFDELKVGDTITVRYYENMVIRLKRPGEAPVRVDNTSVVPSRGARPGATAARQRTVTVTITALDAKASSATVKGPGGYVYSRRVEDKKVFAQLKVGDQVDMTWTEALLIGVEPAAAAKKK